MATKKPKKSAEAKEWVEFPLNIYQEESARLVHFSGKTVNSNVSACGVRVGPESGLDLPLVGVRTLLADGVAVPLDYTQNAGKTATIYKQLRWVESAEAPETAPTEQVQAIQRFMVEAKTSAYEEGTENLSPRLRQILLPKGDGQYVAVTPLGSSGFSAVLNQKLAEWAEQKKPPFARGWLGLGGSNSQNVGGLVREMRNPLLFRAPPEKPLLRRALIIHYWGISLKPPLRLLKEYCEWARAQIESTHKEHMPSTKDIRQEEQEWIGRIAHAVIERGRQAREILEVHHYVLPQCSDGDSLLSSEIDSLIRGLIEPRWRDADWAYLFGLQLARMIAEQSSEQWQRPLADSAIAQIARWIEDAIR